MKKLISIISFIIGCQFIVVNYLQAQDIQRFAEHSPSGTARYVGMGGAMTAIGGDPSAAMDNPAGLGLYRRSEISISIDGTLDYTLQENTDNMGQIQYLALPQASLIWASGRTDKQKGLIYSNLMFNVNRLHSYKREVSVTGEHTGLLPTICLKTNGLSEADMGTDNIWENNEIGWLSILGYDGYLIDSVADNQWTPAVHFNNGELGVSETGSSDLYTISWAGNINNQWYIGASLNIPTLTYTKQLFLQESNGSYLAQLNSLFHVSGVGVNASFGLIARPTQWLRLGASFHTPSVLSMTVQTEGDVFSKINSQEYKILTPASGAISTKYATPLRSSTSIAFQFKNHGMLSLQYDYAHAQRDKELGYSPMYDVHTLRAGLEAQVGAGCYLNAGYVYESTFEPDEKVELAYNSIRTDTDYRFTQSSQYASAGFGYRNQNIVANIAYLFGWQTLHQYATEYQTNPFRINTNTHRIVCTLAWRI